MKREAITHTKLKRLCRRLDLPVWQAVGLLEMLWHVTARETPRGDIGKLSDEDIALALDYRGDESVMVQALINSGWIDQDHLEHRLLVHDWPDHAYDGVHMKLARARQRFATGLRPRSVACLNQSARRLRLFTARCARKHPIRAHGVRTP